MTVAQDPEALHRKITSSLGAMPPAVHHLMMYNFHTTAEKVGLDNLYPRLFIVMDTNQVLGYMIAQARRKKHPLDQLLIDEYAFISAPSQIEFEISNHLNEIAADKRIDPTLLWTIWNSEIRPRIDIQSNISKLAYKEASLMMGNVDPDDVPFLALYLDMGADVILSFDGHIRNVLGTFAWTPGRAKWASVRIREGVVSLFVIHPVGTNAARALGIIAWIVLDALMWIVNSIIEGIRNSIEWVLDWFCGLPGWLQVVLIGGAVYLYDRHRDGIKQWLDSMIVKLREWVNILQHHLDRIVTKVSDWSKFLGRLLGLLLQSVLKGTEELVALRYCA